MDEPGYVRIHNVFCVPATHCCYVMHKLDKNALWDENHLNIFFVKNLSVSSAQHMYVLMIF